MKKKSNTMSISSIINNPSFLKVRKHIIAIPISLIVISHPFIFFCLSCWLTYIGQKDYYNMERNIFKQLFTDQFSDLTSSAMISSPIQRLIMMLLNLLIFLFPNCQIFSLNIVMIILIIYRINSFLEIYSLNTIKDFETNENFIDSYKNYEFTKNDTFSLKSSLPSIQYKSKTSNNSNITEDENKNLKVKKVKTIVELKNSYNNKYITQKMLCSCLVVIAMDFIFLFCFCFPLSFGIVLLTKKNGFFYYLCLVNVNLSYELGEMFGSKQITKIFLFKDSPLSFSPIFIKKKRIGILFGTLSALISSFFLKIVFFNILCNIKINIFIYYIFIIFLIIAVCVGEFIKILLVRCGKSIEQIIVDSKKLDFDEDNKTYIHKKINNDNINNSISNISFITYIYQIAMGLPICFGFYMDN